MADYTLTATAGWRDDPVVPEFAGQFLTAEFRRGSAVSAQLVYRIFRTGSPVPESSSIDLSVARPHVLFRVGSRLLAALTSDVTAVEVVFLHPLARRGSGLIDKPVPQPAVSESPLAAVTAFVTAVSDSLSPETRSWASCDWAVLSANR